MSLTQEESDRLSILLDDAHKALEEAWRITIHAGERRATNDLVIADVKVLDASERLGIVTEGVVARIEAWTAARHSVRA